MQSPTFRMLLDRARIYSRSDSTEVNEYGKPINDKWTLHRVISEIRGILMYVLNDERVFFLSVLMLFLFYMCLGLINYMQVGDERDLLSIHSDMTNIKLQMEILKIKRLELALIREIQSIRATS